MKTIEQIKDNIKGLQEHLDDENYYEKPDEYARLSDQIRLDTLKWVIEEK